MDVDSPRVPIYYGSGDGEGVIAPFLAGPYLDRQGSVLFAPRFVADGHHDFLAALVIGGELGNYAFRVRCFGWEGKICVAVGFSSPVRDASGREGSDLWFGAFAPRNRARAMPVYVSNLVLIFERELGRSGSSAVDTFVKKLLDGSAGARLPELEKEFRFAGRMMENFFLDLPTRRRWFSARRFIGGLSYRRSPGLLVIGESLTVRALLNICLARLESTMALQTGGNVVSWSHGRVMTYTTLGVTGLCVQSGALPKRARLSWANGAWFVMIE